MALLKWPIRIFSFLLYMTAGLYYTKYIIVNNRAVFVTPIDILDVLSVLLWPLFAFVDAIIWLLKII
jgi:hypothetical protein